MQDQLWPDSDYKNHSKTLLYLFGKWGSKPYTNLRLWHLSELHGARFISEELEPLEHLVFYRIFTAQCFHDIHGICDI